MYINLNIHIYVFTRNICQNVLICTKFNVQFFNQIFNIHVGMQSFISIIKMYNMSVQNYSYRPQYFISFYISHVLVLNN